MGESAELFPDGFTKFLIRHPELGKRVFELNAEAGQLLERGDIREAERKLRQAYKICKCAVPVLNNLATCALLRDDLLRAVEFAHKTLEYHPNNIFAHCTLAKCFVRQGLVDAAQDHMRRALAVFKAASAPLEHLNKLIEALAMLGSDEKIWKIYRTFRGEEDLQLVLEPAAWFRIGVAAANRGRWDDAQRFWQQALEGEPELEPAEFYLEVASLVRGGKAPEGAVPEPTSLPRHGT